jgi:hypothetical protein
MSYAKIVTIGIDLGKNTFHVAREALRHQRSRTEL